jgi:hypothetical protein
MRSRLVSVAALRTARNDKVLSARTPKWLFGFFGKLTEAISTQMFSPIVLVNLVVIQAVSLMN